MSDVEERVKNATFQPRGAKEELEVEKIFLKRKLLKMTTQSIIVEERLPVPNLSKTLPCRGTSKARPQLARCPSHQLRGFKATIGTAMSERRRGCMLGIRRRAAQLPQEIRK